MSVGIVEAIAAFLVVAFMPVGGLLIEALSNETGKRQRHLWVVGDRLAGNSTDLCGGRRIHTTRSSIDVGHTCALRSCVGVFREDHC